MLFQCFTSNIHHILQSEHAYLYGAQWLSGRVLDLRMRGRGFEPQQRHCVVSLSNNIHLSVVLVQPRKTRPFITERLLMGRKESNQTNQTICMHVQCNKKVIVCFCVCSGDNLLV